MIRPYITPDDISSMNGFRAEDMDMYGYEQNSSQYQEFLNQICLMVTEIANRWCNVSTYYLHTVNGEFHTLDTTDLYTNSYGVRATYRYWGDPLSPAAQKRNKMIYPREYPVQTVEEVWVNTRRDDQFPSWRKLHTVIPFNPDDPTPIEPPLDNVIDYKFIDDGFDSKYVFFIRNFPAPGTNNVRIVYTAGWEDDAQVIQHMKTACILMAQNFLMLKKKYQEGATIRGAGVVDYAQMFSIGDENYILNQPVKDILNLVKRPALDPLMYS